VYVAVGVHHNNTSFVRFYQEPRNFLLFGAFVPFYLPASLGHQQLWEGAPQGAGDIFRVRYKWRMPSSLTAATLLTTFFFSQTYRFSLLLVNKISLTMSSRHNSMEGGTRPHTEFVETKSESMQEYYTRCPNTWACIRYDAVTDNILYRLIVPLIVLGTISASQQQRCSERWSS
jgi:hypothetical protein